MSNKTYYPRKTMGLLVCFFLSILIPGGLLAQNFSYYNQVKQINESGATPTKASMAYSIDSPVNTLTGAACFDIPIYTIKTGSFTLPISLHYETSGFKVASIPSNVGLGWNLNAGGCITRTVKGFIDESEQVGYCSQVGAAGTIHNEITELSQVDNIDTVLNQQVTDLFSTLLYVTDNLYDAEPDIYSFNFAGYSGNFIYDMENNIHLIPEQNFDIERTNGGFVITVDNGDKYYFGESIIAREIVDSTYNCPLFWKVTLFQRYEADNFLNFRYRYLFNGFLNGYNLKEWDKNYTISWYLTKIEPAQSDKQVLFQYEKDVVRTYIGTDETYLIGNYSSEFEEPLLNTAYDSVVHRINRYRFASVPRLRKITWDNGQIDFIPSSQYREDLNYCYRSGDDYGGRSIDTIIISAMEGVSGNSECFTVNLCHSYFSDLNAIQGPSIGYPDEYLSYYKRLRLDSIVFNDKHGSPLFRYNCVYNRKDNSHCVSRNTSQVDYWGFFKPRGSNCYDFNIERYVIKPTIYYYEDGDENPLYNSVYSVWERSGEDYTCVLEGNSNMVPDLIGSKEFTLSELVLPTGGKLHFEYELNDFFFDDQDISGPGVRVKEIQYIGLSDLHSTYKRYYYREGNHSSGRVGNIPVIGIRNLASDAYGFLGGITDEKQRVNYKTARQFSTVTDMSNTCESLVQYGKVTEESSWGDESTGKTIYHNQLNLTVTDSVLMAGDDVFIKKTNCRWSYLYEYPNIHGIGYNHHHNEYYQAEHVDNTPIFTPPIYSWYNGFLTKKEQFDKNDKLVESTEYKYSLKPSDDSVLYIQSKYLCKYSTVWHIPEFAAGLPQQGFTYNYVFPIYLYDILWGVNYYKTGVRQLDTIIHKYYSEGNGNLANVTTRTFNYTVNNYVSEERTENSDGSVIKQTYNYPLEYATCYPNSVYADMLDRNMLNSVVEQYTSVDNKVTQGACCRFETTGSNNEFIKPEKLFKLRTNNPLTNFQPLGQDSHYELTDEMKYDPSSGNLVEIWDESDGRTTYVWGFHNSLLLAKIQNATDSEVRNALSCTMEALQEKTDTNELIGIFQNLRTSLPSARVTSYAYDLFQNLVSITDPSGKTNRFEYDDALRLKLTRDVENNILQKYEYHYHQ